MISIPFSELEFDYVRSRGPGGQNVNRTNTAVILRWNPSRSLSFSEETKFLLIQKLEFQLTKEGDLVIRSEEHRSQDMNRDEAIRKLHALIAAALHRPKKRVKTKPTFSSKKKRVDTKRKDSLTKKLRQKVSRES